MFLYEKAFTIITDHQALITIYGNPRAKIPPRIERWGIRLMDYDFKIIHKQGKDHNPTDYESRHPLPSTQLKPSLAEEYLNFILRQNTPTTITVKELVQESQNDSTLKEIKKIMKDQRCRHINNNCQFNRGIDKEEILAFKHVQEELSETEQGTLLRGTQIIIPRALRRQTIDLAHESHRGIIATKKALREKVWFPGLNRMVEEMIVLPPVPKHRATLQAGATKNVKSP